MQKEVETQPLSRYSLPHLVDENEIVVEQGGKAFAFTELRLKKEHFAPMPHHKGSHVINSDTMVKPGALRFDEIDLDKIKAFSLAAETISVPTPVKKVTMRVVLFSDTGERVLDTLIEPPTCLQEDHLKQKMVFKDGIKTKLMSLAAARGPSITVVSDFVECVIKGKDVMAYHLPIKL